MPGTYTISELAREAEVPASTVRYYERRGLLPPDGRTESNYRVYGARSLERHCDIGVLMATARIVHATRSPIGLPPNPEIAENGRQFRQECLGMLDAKIADGPFVGGDRVTVGLSPYDPTHGFITFRLREGQGPPTQQR